MRLGVTLREEEMSGKTILILGGGVGGYTAATELRARLPRAHRVIVVDRDARPAFAPSFLWLMTGGRASNAIRKDLHALTQQGIEFVNASVDAIDPAARRVTTSNDALDYDYLIVALGAELAPETIPNLAATAHTPYSLSGAENLRDARRDFGGGRVVVVIASLPYKCPAAPYETALLLDADLARRRVPHTVEIYTPEGLPMPVAGPAIGKEVKQILDQRGIGFHPKVKLTAVSPESKELSFDDGTKTNFDFLVAVPPHRAPRVARESGLADASGWIPIDRLTMKTSVEGVYAIGDITANKIPGRHFPDVPLMLPKAGVFAHGQAKVVAHNIAGEILGQSAAQVWDGFGACFLETGAGQAGFATGFFYAEPAPQVDLRAPNAAWHVGKVMLEKEWHASGFARALYRAGIIVGARVMGVKGDV